MNDKARRVLPSELTIRKATLADQSLLDSFLSDERIAEMSDSGFTQADQQTREQVLALIDQGMLKGWIVELPGHGPLSAQIYAPAGTPGVWSGDTLNAPGLGRLGLRWIGTSSMAITLDELFKDPEIHRLTGYVTLANVASLAMCDRLGFTREGLAREHMPHADGGRMDAVVMGLLRHEWVGSAAIEKQAAA